MRRGRWTRKPGFRVVSVKQARRETGLTVSELAELPNTELLTRVYVDGRKETAIRLPAQPVSEEKSVR
jgi:hypothetical protein